MYIMFQNYRILLIKASSKVEEFFFNENVEKDHSLFCQFFFNIAHAFVIYLQVKNVQIKNYWNKIYLKLLN